MVSCYISTRQAATQKSLVPLYYLLVQMENKERAHSLTLAGL